jgi:3-hydroxyacyl-[acyl-carrier-protein] dehydratase
VIGIAGIKRIIPHRHPVLLLDRVSEVQPGRTLVAHKAITGTEPCYATRGDEAPSAMYAYPLGQLMESWAQAAVCLVRWFSPNPDVRAGRVELLTGLRNVAVLGPVYPGDVVEHRIELVRAVSNAAVLTGSSLVDGRPVLRIGTLTIAQRGLEDEG